MTPNRNCAGVEISNFAEGQPSTPSSRTTIGKVYSTYFREGVGRRTEKVVKPFGNSGYIVAAYRHT